MIIHQIYGLFDDGKDMPVLFKTNKNLVIEWCKVNSYTYFFWDKKCCDRLINKYPEFKEMYYSVKYPVQKVDIIRFLILHYYGGLYMDLDVFPKKDLVLEDYDFAVCNTQTNRNKKYEMEVLQSCVGNPILTEFLRYVKTQILEKDEIDIYDQWKCRYIYQTTGPMSLCRFLKNKKYNELNYKVNTYNLNNPDYDGDMDLNLTGEEDFISQISCSYN
mgnify:FL=1